MQDYSKRNVYECLLIFLTLQIAVDTPKQVALNNA